MNVTTESTGDPLRDSKRQPNDYSSVEKRTRIDSNEHFGTLGYIENLVREGKLQQTKEFLEIVILLLLLQSIVERPSRDEACQDTVRDVLTSSMVSCSWNVVSWS